MRTWNLDMRTRFCLPSFKHQVSSLRFQFAFPVSSFQHQVSTRTPFPPHLTIGRLNSPCKRFSIAQVRTLHKLAHGGAKPFQLSGISGQLNCTGNIIGLGFGDQIRHIYLGQNTCSDAGDVAIPSQGDNRNPHPQGFTGGGGPIVRKRIKSDIHLII